MKIVDLLFLNKIKIFLLLLLIASISAFYFQTGNFSPDSWTYFELSKTFYTTSFYEPNTIRNYLDYEKSSSFPFGFPFMLSVINKIFLESPVNSVYLNIFSAFLSIIFLFQITKELKFNNLMSLAVTLSFFFYPPYLSEIYSGRSIPLATLLFILGFLVFIKYESLFFSMVFIGISAVVRFDFLIFSLLFAFYVFIFSKEIFLKKIIILVAILISLSPWIVFSLEHFDSLWASDNSWVSKSAVSDYVLDFPASSDKTIINAPYLWVLKVINNIPHLTFSFLKASAFQSLSIFLLLIFFYLIFIKNIYLSRQDFVFIFVMIMSFFPYLTTGYFSRRYFSFHFLMINLYFACRLNNFESFLKRYTLLTSVILSIFLGALFFARGYLSIEKNREDNLKQMDIIKTISSKHSQETGITYIFFGSDTFAAKYGAFTGLRSAMPPANFGNMTEIEKNNYFNTMGEFRIIHLDDYLKK